MKTNIVICPDCRRVVAIAARVPATCFAAIPEGVKAESLAHLEAHPAAHRRCLDLPVLAPDGLEGSELIAAVESLYAEQIKALSDAAAAVAA